jgi:hypothetical protein
LRSIRCSKGSVVHADPDMLITGGLHRGRIFRVRSCHDFFGRGNVKGYGTAVGLYNARVLMIRPLKQYSNRPKRESCHSVDLKSANVHGDRTTYAGMECVRRGS